MSLNQSERDLIDHYLNGELSGIELAAIENRMQEDARFKNQVFFHDMLRKGILFSKEEELKKIILGNVRYKKARIPFALKLIVTFLVVTVMGISLWFYIGTDSSTNHNRFSLSNFLSKENEKKANKKSSEARNKARQKDEKTSGISQQNVDVGKENKSQLAAEFEGGNGEIEPAFDSTIIASEEDRDIVIKKDKLLISATLSVIERPSSDLKSADLNPDNSPLSQEAIQKLNPDAGVPEEEMKANRVLVEFWLSPVHYKGYKMSKNKIILFGLEEPDAVKLFRSNDMVFLKYGNDYYKLVNTFDFLSYQQLKEAEVPLAIRQ